MIIENDFAKNQRHYPKPPLITAAAILSKDPPSSSMRKEDEWESIDEKVIYPREVVESSRIPAKKIHDQSLYGADENDWGGLDAHNNTSSETEDVKYGPGNYPDDDTVPDLSALRAKAIKGHYTHFTTHEAKIAQPQTIEADWKWIIPDLLAAGPHPTFNKSNSQIDQSMTNLRKTFKAIVSVYDEPLSSKYSDSLEYLFVPTISKYSNDLSRICQFIDRQVEKNNAVFIHDLTSIGRTGTVLAAYFIYKNWLTADEAIAYIRQKYNSAAIESTYQEDELRRLAANV
jgi:hypothetical protein